MAEYAAAASQEEEEEVAVVYASSTGTARELAYKTAECLRRHGLAKVATGEPRSLDWRIEEEGGSLLLGNRGVVVIILSTTGDGEAPAMMRKCWRALLSKDAPRCDGLRYALYGLGDARYGDKFNAAARRLDARLKQLGATELTPRLLSDACAPRGGVLAPYADWTASLLASLGLDQASMTEEVAPVPRFSLAGVTEVDSEEADREMALYVDRALASIETPVDLYDTGVATIERLTSDKWWQNVRHIRLEGSSEVSYDVGDVAVVLGSNSKHDVERCLAICARCAAPPQEYYETKETVGSYRAPRLELPRVARLSALLERCFDLARPPSQDSLARLAPHCTDAEQREKMAELSTTEGALLFEDYVQAERRSLLDVCEDFDSCSPPLDALLDELQTLTPRLFSIASKPTEEGSLDLCVAQVDFKTPYKRDITGLCSTYLCEKLKLGDQIRIGITRAAISTALQKRPLAEDTRLILVGAGTGVAPLRALAQTSSSRNTTLYFGCRDDAQDYLYSSEWPLLPGLNVRLAVSRHKEAAERAYVTRRIREDAAEIVQALTTGGASLFVAGNAQMATDLRAELHKLIMEHAKLDAKKATALLTKLEKQSRIAVEAYG